MKGICQSNTSWFKNDKKDKKENERLNITIRNFTCTIIGKNEKIICVYKWLVYNSNIYELTINIDS